MAAEWMPVVRLPISWEQFQQLPRNAAYKYEYFDGQALLSPRPRFYHALLSLAPLRKRPLTGAFADVELRPLQDNDWEALVPVFAGAFHGQQPFSGLDPERRKEAARRSLEFTRSGGDGPLIAPASFTAIERGFLIGAILVTLLPEMDPADWRAYHWEEAPPADCIARRLGRPHLTWIFVASLFAGHGVGTALLQAAARQLLALGFRQLSSTFLPSNDSSMLWHWRNGFRLLAFPGSMRPVLKRPRKKPVHPPNADRQ
jgi:GNAT superfamily N-acetyltransferase